jgi:hypothetical protein
VFANDDWQELSRIVEQIVIDGEPRRSQLKWLRPNKLVQSDQLPVEALLTVKDGKYSVTFQRFGSRVGAQNFELPPVREHPYSKYGQ